MEHKLKILHCPTDVGGNALTLARCERELGLDSRVMVYGLSDLCLPVDIDLKLNNGSKMMSMIRMVKFFLEASSRFDVFHFNYGSSLFCGKGMGLVEFADLPVLKALRKKIVVTYQGCDARQKKYCITHFPINACHESGWCDKCSNHTDKLKINRIKKFGFYAHKIFSVNPDLMYLLPASAEFLPYSSVDPRTWHPVKKLHDSKTVIVHAPTNRDVKGTKYINMAVERLQKEKNNVEYIEINGLPHDKARELYLKADIAVDQLLIGWYGAFAVEMMALGKPVVCYIREEDLKFIPADMKADIPIINANPGNIYFVLKKLIEERNELDVLGERGRNYVERWHDSMKIARKLKALYES